MEYFKCLKFWKCDDKVENVLTEGLTEEQIKKYRKQYLDVAFDMFLFSITYIISVVILINMFFNKQFWTLALVILILKDYNNLVKKLSDESELIVERIKKRKIKNKKQNKRSV